MNEHRGPVCKQCGTEFYYDYLDKPERHEGSGYCWLCFSDWEEIRKAATYSVAPSKCEGE